MGQRDELYICIAQWLTGCSTGSSNNPPIVGCALSSWVEKGNGYCIQGSPHRLGQSFYPYSSPEDLYLDKWEPDECGCAPIADLESGIYDSAIRRLSRGKSSRS